MAEALKNHYNKRFIQQLAEAINNVYPGFNQHNFSRCIFNQPWQNMELKQRMRHITYCLQSCLPSNYPQAINILLPVAEKFSGFEYMFFPDYVECSGLHDFELSMPALAHFTQYASAEFAVRAFIVDDEPRMMAQMQQWAESDNLHLRRLASEGCRPRLPWAKSLPVFKQNPAPVFKILQKLMCDENDYVRRSVANNLNDISKDHPAQVLDWCKHRWGKHPQTDWIIKHACRTLLKQAHPEALVLFDYKLPAHIKVETFSLQKSVHMNDTLEFSFTLNSGEKNLGKLRIEYAIDFMKANGKQARKVFKISASNYSIQQKTFKKYYSFKPLSTRKYYAGQHGLSIIVNGETFVQGSFTLHKHSG